MPDLPATVRVRHSNGNVLTLTRHDQPADEFGPGFTAYCPSDADRDRLGLPVWSSLSVRDALAADLPMPVTAPHAGPVEAQTPEDAADLATLYTLHAMFGDRARATGSPDAVYYHTATAAALSILASPPMCDGDALAVRAARMEAVGRGIRSGLVWDQFLPVTPCVMLDAVNAAIWARALTLRTPLDVPSTGTVGPAPALITLTQTPARRIRTAA